MSVKSVSIYTTSSGEEKRGLTSFQPKMEHLLKQRDVDPPSRGQGTKARLPPQGVKAIPLP